MTWTTGVLSLVLPPDEAEAVSGVWFLPLILAPIACLLGAIGGVWGRSFARRSRA